MNYPMITATSLYDYEEFIDWFENSIDYKDILLDFIKEKDCDSNSPEVRMEEIHWIQKS